MRRRALGYADRVMEPIADCYEQLLVSIEEEMN